MTPLKSVQCVAVERAGFTPIVAIDGQAALCVVQRYVLDMGMLDVGMPQLDSLEVCRRLRAASAVPILILTKRDKEKDRVLGLGMAADTYVTRPFSPPELVTRIKAILKRTNIHESDRALDSHLSNLRSKLADTGCPGAIETLHGVGLRMGPCTTAQTTNGDHA
jgi:two-component system OmpR family response regulator